MWVSEYRSQNIEDISGISVAGGAAGVSVEWPGTTAAVLWQRQVSECRAASKGRHSHS